MLKSLVEECNKQESKIEKVKNEIKNRKEEILKIEREIKMYENT